MINFNNAEKSSELFSDLTPAEMKTACLMGAVSAELINKRHQMGMTQNDFADFLGVSQGMVSKWEKPGYNFTISALVNLFEKIDVNFDVVLNGKSALKKNTHQPYLVAMQSIENWNQTVDDNVKSDKKVEGAA